MKFVFLTVLSAVYSQVVIKWRVSRAGVLPDGVWPKVAFLTTLLTDPWVISAIFITFVGGISWMVAMTKVELSYAYPFIGLVFVLMLIASSILFHETFTIAKVIGVLLVAIGIFVSGLR